MALPPISGRGSQPPAQGPAPADPRAAAQRAFFQTALDKAAASGAVASAPAVRAEGRAVQPAVTKLKDEAPIPPHPGRILRPGSIVDIKV